MSTDYEKMSDRDLDAMVAERLFGYQWQDVRAKGETNTHRVLCKPNTIHDGEWMMFQLLVVGAPDYTTDPSAWWEVVEHFDVGFVQIDNGWRTAPHDRGWTVKIVAPGQEGEATAVNIGRAVCIAALRALDAQAGGA